MHESCIGSSRIPDLAATSLPPLLLLKDGAGRPPIFIAHGLGGSVMEVFQLANHINLNTPIHGMQARGLDGVTPPFECIEDMAQFHLQAIRQLQPQGPYFLIGYSLGGLVTLEIAQRLTALGEKIALLAMLDSYPHIRFLSFLQRLRLNIRRSKDRALAMLQLPVGEAYGILLNHHHHQTVDAATSAIQRVRHASQLALTQYCPRFYNGKINFFQAVIPSSFPDDPAAIWSKLANEFEMETVPGDHLGIITTDVESLAAVLSNHLKNALAETKQPAFVEDPSPKPSKDTR